MRGAVAVPALLLQLLCFQAVSQSDASPAPMAEKEKEALYSMIQGFVGKGWNGSELYPDPCGWTSIQGVSCDLFDNGMWYITAVSVGPIFENSLQCSEDAVFRPALLELNHLRSLTVFNCFSSPTHQATTFPSLSWSRLSASLQTLEFRSNKKLVGEIPPVLGQLVNLESLVLTDNSLTGKIPWELGNLVHLKRLTLSANQLSGQVPASLGSSLVELLIMDMNSNALTGPLPSSLGGLSSLLKLDLNNNFFSGNLPEEFSKLQNLTLLDLRNNNISGGLSPSSLQGLVSLRDMLLCNNPIGGSIQKINWAVFRNLTHLDLSNTSLVGEIPDSITELKEMRFLALDSNKLSGFVSAKLAAMPKLGALYLHGNNLTGELRFSEEFYSRMGTRFASWNNPNLCYRFAAENETGEGPAGVSECEYGEKKSAQDPNGGNIADRLKTGECSDCMASSTGITASFTGITASSILGCVWIRLLGVEVILLLIFFV